MAWTVDHPQRRHAWQYEERVAARVRIYHPLSVAGMAMLATLMGAWAGIVAFVGPDFGFRPTSASTWQWTTDNWLLHLIPGAVAVGAGLIMMSMARARTAASRGLIRLAVLAMMAAGTWLVIGPALWPVFESSQPYGPATSARLSFAHQVGANLGPGLILVALAAMILEAVATSRPTAVDAPAADAAGDQPSQSAVAATPTTPPAARAEGEPSATETAAAPTESTTDAGTKDRRGGEATGGR